MPRPPAPLPAGLGDVFLAGQRRPAGATEGRLRAADLERPFRGVRARRLDAPQGEAPRVGATRGEASRGEGPGSSTMPPDDIARAEILARARAHSLILPDHAFYIGTTALAALDLPFLDALAAAADDLQVAVFAPHRALRRPGIRSVKVQPGLAFTTIASGLRVATPATTWALLGRDLDVRDLVKLGDAIARIPRDDRGRRRPELQLATPAQLRAAIEAGRRQGAERLRTALPRITEHSMSLLETDWRENLRDSDLPDPVLDHEVRNHRGILLGISDGAFPEYRVALEIEGDHHRVTRRQWDRDIDKQAAYATVDWELVRLTARHIRPSRGRDIALVRQALIRRGWHP